MKMLWGIRGRSNSYRQGRGVKEGKMIFNWAHYPLFFLYPFEMNLQKQLGVYLSEQQKGCLGQRKQPQQRLSNLFSDTGAQKVYIHVFIQQLSVEFLLCQILCLSVRDSRQKRHSSCLQGVVGQSRTETCAHRIKYNLESTGIEFVR